MQPQKTHLVCSSHVHSIDQIPIFICDILEADIAENACIVDDDVDTAKVVNRSLDDRLAILDAVVVGGSLSTRLLDFLDDDICGL